MKYITQEIWNPERECMDPFEKKKWQLDNLKKIVKYCYERQEFYRNKMDAAGVKPEDIQTLEDIEKLPFMTKNDIRDNYPYGLLCVPTTECAYLIASSGTTGKMTFVPCTKNDIDILAESVARNFYKGHATKNSILQNAFNYGLSMSGMCCHFAIQKFGGMEIPISSGNAERQLKFLMDTGADALVCTPSYAMRIVDEMDKLGITKDDLTLRSGFFAGEASSDSMLRTLKEKLGVQQVYDTYGSSEITVAGGTCDYMNGIHFPDDLVYPEVIDPTTKRQVPMGEKGELVVTTMLKEGMPLIRFRMGDITAMHDDPCPCGRTAVRLERIQGRVDDMVTIRGGNVFPTQIEIACYKCDFLNGFYHITVTRENALDVLTVDCELTPECANNTDKFDEYKAILIDHIKAICGVRAEINLRQPQSMPRSDELKAKKLTDLRKIFDNK